GETTGFCKLIVRQNGIILGAHLVGSDAGELISAIALMIKNKIKINSSSNFISPSLTLSEIIDKTVIEWQRQRFKRHPRLGNYLESLFICLRNWSN
ncbi:MAG: mercuric reductase, partial [Microcystaceae cyanobacterium]